MSDCKCGEWKMDGICVKCGEHYTDAWGEMQDTIDALRLELKHYKMGAAAEARAGDEARAALAARDRGTK